MANYSKTPYVEVRGSDCAEDYVPVLGSKGKVTGISSENNTEAEIFLQIFDSTTPPVSETTIPTWISIPIPAGGYYESTKIRRCDTGCIIAASSTRDVFTDIGSSGVPIDVSAEY